jgi:hypothetical protein
MNLLKKDHRLKPVPPKAHSFKLSGGTGFSLWVVHA